MEALNVTTFGRHNSEVDDPSVGSTRVRCSLFVGAKSSCRELVFVNGNDDARLALKGGESRMKSIVRSR